MAGTVKNIVLCLCSVATVLIFAEILVRLFGYAPKDSPEIFRLKVCGEILCQFDKELFWRFPGSSPSLEPGWQDASIRIICLTDSVSVMYQGKGYPDILRTRLSGRLPHEKIAVFNGGVPGYTSYQGLKWLRKELLAFDPNVLIVCFGWNDHSKSGNGVPDKLQNPGPYLTMARMSKHSALVSFLLSSGSKLREFDPNEPCLDTQRRVSPEDYQENLLAIADECRSRGIFLVMMTAPYLITGQSETWVPVHRRYNEIVRRISKTSNMVLLDGFENFTTSPDLFIDPINDGCHYNWKGAEQVAQHIAAVILGNLPRIKGSDLGKKMKDRPGRGG
jgi:lysophospholipase L1-like esterase